MQITLKFLLLLGASLSIKTVGLGWSKSTRRSKALHVLFIKNRKRVTWAALTANKLEYTNGTAY